VTWRPWLEPEVLRQMRGLPVEAWDVLVRTLARVCDDPYNPVYSSPAQSRSGNRVADLNDSGFIEFGVDEAEGLIRVYELVWSG
jgi:hypothetical protein